MTKTPFVPLEPDEINKLQLEQLKASYSVVVDDDILFAATLLLSVSNLANLKSEPLSAVGKKGPVRSCTLAPKNLDWKDEDTPSKPCKKRRSTSHVSKVSEFSDRICAYCKCTETPMWRHGPPEFQNLCNKGDSKCIATPGFAGFVPSLKYQFGLTYGNATRQILRTDPSLKKGFIQTELARKARKAPTVLESFDEGVTDDKPWVWKGRNKYATGDDRFSFPPVPGYTGYIPRSQEHFGRAYVETTNASLASFQKMLKSKNQLPPRIQAIKARAEQGIPEGSTFTTSANDALKAQAASNVESAGKKVEKKTFISGYTGYVPRLQNHFGETYSSSVSQAIEEFSTPRPSRNPYSGESKVNKGRTFKKVQTKPIPGFTGYIPGSRSCDSTTFGKTSEIAYENFNQRDEKGINQSLKSQLPEKDLAKTLPIPGYRGHIPRYIYSSERSYGISAKECIKQFSAEKAAEKKLLQSA